MPKQLKNEKGKILMLPLENKKILLGITGSIACYKSADLASKLSQLGADVNVILTEAATKFISPLTFQSVTGKKAYTDKDLWGDEGHVLHIGLSQGADLVIIAPATANTIAKIAHGEAGNLLTLTLLASECPVLVAPAMDGGMYSHPATQANLKSLEERGVTLIGPEMGHLASGLKMVGRMSEPQKLVSATRYMIGKKGMLAGEKIVVTAGGTREALDPVRYLTNRSSGKQGYAIAQAAIDFGATVSLISSAVGLPEPFGVNLVKVDSARQMKEKVLENIPLASALIMAAAVADFSPEEISKEKIKKGERILNLTMVKTEDILLEVAKNKIKTGFPNFTIGFAAESENLLKNAKDKLLIKSLDLIVANDISKSHTGFLSDDNLVTIIDRNLQEKIYPVMSKYQVGILLMEEITSLKGKNN
jgi:phosphopantothenoylcysteine decarboxylase / phosphopantothenate---cysteine ligase